MDTQRFIERRDEFIKAVLRLQDACEQPFNSFLRDSVIQRFEFCWELAWKAMRLWLEYLGVQATNPRDTFREALQNGLIEDGNAWSELQRMRNLTTRTYDEKLADQVYNYVKGDGLRLFALLSQEAGTWQPGTQ